MEIIVNIAILFVLVINLAIKINEKFNIVIKSKKNKSRKNKSRKNVQRATDGCNNYFRKFRPVLNMENREELFRDAYVEDEIIN